MKAFWGLALLVLMLCGCAQGLDKKIVGHWKVDTAQSKVDAPPGTSEAEMKMGMTFLGTFKLEIKGDKTFVLDSFGAQNGTWTLNGNKLSLAWTNTEKSSTTFGGKAGMEFDVDASGSKMSMNMEEKGMKATLVWVKDEAAK